MGAPSKKAKKTRTKDEFDLAKLANEVLPPATSPNVFAWGLDDIYTARSEQQLGRFRLPARMAEAMRTDDAIAVPKEGRLAPQESIAVKLEPGRGARAASVAGEAEALFGQNGIGIAPETLSDVHDCLVDHGVAFGQNIPTTRDDGSRIDFALKPWPIEFVRWDPIEKVYKTLTADGPEEPIIHGDGKWVVFQKHQIYPFKKRAAIIPAALVWARHAFAARDWSKGSLAHGSAKIIGKLAPGVPLQDTAGKLTADALALLQLLRMIATSDLPLGVLPAGAEAGFVANSGTNWQVWKELIANAERAAARIYLGTDALLGAVGGAPGVDITALFGVSGTLVQGDLDCISRAINTGTIEPWTAVNFGDSSLAPTRKYLVPDEEEDERVEQTQKRRAAFYADITAAREAGFAITPDFVEAVAEEYGVDDEHITIAATPASPATSSPALRSVG